MLPRHPKLRSGALAASRRWWLPRCSLLRCAPRVPPAFPLEKYMPRWLNKRVLTILEPHPPCSLAFSPLSGCSPQPLHLRSRPALLCIALRAVSPPCLSAASQPNPSQSRPLCHRIAPRRSSFPDRSFLCAFCRSTTARAPPFPADLIHHRRRSNRTSSFASSTILLESPSKFGMFPAQRGAPFGSDTTHAQPFTIISRSTAVTPSRTPTTLCSASVYPTSYHHHPLASVDSRRQPLPGTAQAPVMVFFPTAQAQRSGWRIHHRTSAITKERGYITYRSTHRRSGLC